MTKQEQTKKSEESKNRAIALAREYDFVLAVDECYAEIYTRDPPVGGLEAALAMDTTGGKDPFRNLAHLGRVEAFLQFRENGIAGALRGDAERPKSRRLHCAEQLG